MNPYKNEQNQPIQERQKNSRERVVTVTTFNRVIQKEKGRKKQREKQRKLGKRHC